MSHSPEPSSPIEIPIERKPSVDDFAASPTRGRSPSATLPPESDAHMSPPPHDQTSLGQGTGVRIHSRVSAQRSSARPAPYNQPQRKRATSPTRNRDPHHNQRRPSTSTHNGTNNNPNNMRYARQNAPGLQFGTGALGLTIDGRSYSLHPPTGHPMPRPPAANDRDSAPQYLIRTNLQYSLREDIVVASLELPGSRLEDVSVKVVNKSYESKCVLISAYLPAPRMGPDYITMQERMHGNFVRTLIIPSHISAADIRAEMSDGILKLTIPGTKYEQVVIREAQEN